MASRALLIAVLSLPIVLLSTDSGRAQSRLAVIDNSPFDDGDGPGDNMIFSVRRNATYIVSMAFNRGQAVTHRIENSGQLTKVGSTPTGPEPRAIAMAQNGDYAVIVNSIANQVVVMAIGDDGLLREVNRYPSGGVNPYDVAVGYDDIVVVANRDSDQINTFHLDRRGNLTPLAQAAAGIDPHVVSVSRNGLVGVANQTDRSVSLYELNRRGELIPLGDPIAMSIPGSNPPASMIPRTLTWRDHHLFLALDGPGSEDFIRWFNVRRRGQIEFLGDTPAGAFLTDLEANEDGLFAVTANRNNPADPTAPRDEVRVYRIERTGLVLDAAVQTGVFPPNYKKIATARGRGGKRHVLFTEFQSDWLRSLIYSPDEP